MNSANAAQQDNLLKRYVVSTVLGAGRFGRCMLATDVKTSSLCVLKYINAPLGAKTSAILNNYLRVKHPNILRHLAFIANHRRSADAVADTTVLITEFAKYGALRREVERRRAALIQSSALCSSDTDQAQDLSEALSADNCATSYSTNDSRGGDASPFDCTSPAAYFCLEDIWLIVIQLLLGLRHLHKQGEVHRDVTLQNIYLTASEHLVKLGHCHAFDYTVDMNLAPPELHTGPLTATWTPACDVWAFGCVLYELLTLTPPRHNWDTTVELQLLKHLPKDWCVDLSTILKACLEVAAPKRATISSLMSMGEVLRGYQYLVLSRRLDAEPKLKHVLHYWEKSACRKLKLAKLQHDIDRTGFIPQPALRASAEYQILSPGRAATPQNGDRGIRLLERLRSGRFFQMPVDSDRIPQRYMYRASIRRSLSQEARDKFSRADMRQYAAKQLLPRVPGSKHSPGTGNSTSRSARARPEEPPVLRISGGGCSQSHRSTIAAEAHKFNTPEPKLVRMLQSSSGLECLSPISRVTTPPLDTRQAHTPTIARAGEHYEIPIPREDRASVWRGIQRRAEEYRVIEDILAACLRALETPPPRRIEAPSIFPKLQKRAVATAPRRMPRTQSHAQLSQTVQKAFDLARATTRDGTLITECRKTVERATLFPPGLANSSALPGEWRPPPEAKDSKPARYLR